MKKVSLLGKSTFVSAKVDQKCWLECDQGFEWQSADPADDMKVKICLYKLFKTVIFSTN